MSSESTSNASGKPRGTPFWVAAGFIAAFGATIVTVILTGLYVRAPGSGVTTKQASHVASQVGSAKQQQVGTERAQADAESAQPDADSPQRGSEGAQPGQETDGGDVE